MEQHKTDKTKRCSCEHCGFHGRNKVWSFHSCSRCFFSSIMSSPSVTMITTLFLSAEHPAQKLRLSKTSPNARRRDIMWTPSRYPRGPSECTFVTNAPTSIPQHQNRLLSSAPSLQAAHQKQTSEKLVEKNSENTCIIFEKCYVTTWSKRKQK